MPRIELQQLLRPTTTPDQEILLSHFYNQFDNRSAANRQIVNVEPLYYQGAVAGTEFLTYAATKLYICYNIQGCGGGNVPTSSVFVLYNENDAISLNLTNANIFFDAAAAVERYYNNMIIYNNFYFSRFVLGGVGISHILFNGYRVTLI